MDYITFNEAIAVILIERDKELDADLFLTENRRMRAELKKIGVREFDVLYDIEYVDQKMSWIV